MKRRANSVAGWSVVAFLALTLAVVAAHGASAALGDTIRVSQRPNGAGVNGDSLEAVVSSDGRYVAFESYADDLVLDDHNGQRDVFLRDLASDQVIRVSVDSAGSEATGYSYDPSISADGRYIAFTSLARNLVEDDTNDASDVFVHDTQAGATTRVSVDDDGNEGNQPSSQQSISGDGRYVAFVSGATNFGGDTDDRADVFVHDTTTGDTRRVSVDSGGTPSDGISLEPSLSFDGRRIAFGSDATNLVPDDTNDFNDVFVHDLDTDQTRRVSVDADGFDADNGSYFPIISADGRYIAFESLATDLVAGDTNTTQDVFVHDTQTGNTIRVSVDSNGIEVTRNSYLSGISADGRQVAFSFVCGQSGGGRQQQRIGRVHPRHRDRSNRQGLGRRQRGPSRRPLRRWRLVG